MSKPYNPTKHLKLNKFKQEGYAYFENIDFSASDNKDILATMLLDFPRIVFQKCIFKSLIATKQIFNATISFDECKFTGEVDFSESIFNKVVSFKNSSFHGKTLFINTVFKSTLEFFNNVIKPNIKGEVSFKVDKAIKESDVFSGLQFNNVKFGTETSFFGRDFGLVGFLKNTEFGDLFWMTKSSFGEKFEMTNLNFTGAKRTEFLKCLEIFKNSLKRSSFDLYADEVNKYEELMRSKVSQPVINIHNMPIPEIPVKEGDYNLYTTEEAATILHVKQNTLERWRCERKGPKATKIGRKVFYKKCDLDEYINKYK